MNVVPCTDYALDNSILRAAGLIKKTRRMVLISGAGLSEDSGMIDIRSESGRRGIDPRSAATVKALECNYDLFHQFFSVRVNHLKDALPHEGHYILAEWEKRGLLAFIGTQNVDGLHQSAGSRNVHELYGTIGTFRCHACGMPHSEEAFQQKLACPCGGNLRPNVVLFDESPHEEAWRCTLDAIREADLLLVVGTGREIPSVNRLFLLTGAPRIFINPEKTGYEDQFDVFVKGRILDALFAIEEAIS
jgi:NAD-dependent deacetylase